MYKTAANSCSRRTDLITSSGSQEGRCFGIEGGFVVLNPSNSAIELVCHCLHCFIHIIHPNAIQYMAIQGL